MSGYFISMSGHRARVLKNLKVSEVLDAQTEGEHVTIDVQEHKCLTLSELRWFEGLLAVRQRFQGSGSPYFFFSSSGGRCKKLLHYFKSEWTRMGFGGSYTFRNLRTSTVHHIKNLSPHVRRAVHQATCHSEDVASKFYVPLNTVQEAANVQRLMEQEDEEEQQQEEKEEQRRKQQQDEEEVELQEMQGLASEEEDDECARAHCSRTTGFGVDPRTPPGVHSKCQRSLLMKFLKLERVPRSKARSQAPVHKPRPPEPQPDSPMPGRKCSRKTRVYVESSSSSDAEEPRLPRHAPVEGAGGTPEPGSSGRVPPVRLPGHPFGAGPPAEARLPQPEGYVA
ncbi:histone H3.v1-like [Trichomycterus rosablanca]|uniref:histone H3.v1-like n=1 Tax=Trichomycterus rosablanca TaxID=2290929 RepID=UPI002F34F613